ncbi:hypothetical protein [Wenxinia marina]|uniref:Membrane protein (DUF2238) n=1 Tax=Wenxinia marina DSM 24838 TaxID=1123501 RepID=A0A0D0NIF6_9RHOB|nr:hypothetical protein [Wenxinia marina]KIQ68115.1 hypothetical protein Wenmar_03330 [Wenxinia marina DSM 24838]GGL78422.1 hypothetical protein GCM10011392_36090 [Wenxinia marina]
MSFLSLTRTEDGARPVRIAVFGIWLAAFCLGGVAIVTGDMLLSIGVGGAIFLALLLPAYTWVSGIEMPPGLCTGVLAFALCAFVVGERFGAYAVSWWWDIALHLLSSAVLALIGQALVLLMTAGAPPRTGLWVASVLAVGFAALVGAGWELMEFSIDAIFDTHAQRSGLPDTMGDVATNLCGAIYGAVAGQLALSRAVRLPLSGLLLEFCGRNGVIYGAWPGVPLSRSPKEGARTAAPTVETT